MGEPEVTLEDLNKVSPLVGEYYDWVIKDGKAGRSRDEIESNETLTEGQLRLLRKGCDDVLTVCDLLHPKTQG